MSRPRDHAPSGYVTVREAAEILRVSEQAVRARMGRGTLPERVEHLQSGEARHYIPREALVSNGHGPVTKEDAAEITLVNAMHAAEIIENVSKELNRRADTAELQRREIFEKVEALENATAQIGGSLLETLEETRRQTEILRETLARKGRRPKNDRGLKILACIVAVCAVVTVVLLLLIAFEIMPFLPSISAYVHP